MPFPDCLNPMTSLLPDHPMRQQVCAAQRRAEVAGAAHAHRRVQAVALVLRPVFPAAAAIVADLTGWFAEELIPGQVEVLDATGTMLWCDDGTGVPRLPTGHPDLAWPERRQAIEEHLSVAVEFATPSLAGWHDLDPDGDLAQYQIPLLGYPDHHGPAVSGGRSPVAWAVWVLRHVDAHDEDITVHATRQDALSALARIVRSRWDSIADQAGVPATPDRLTDQQALDVYFARSPSWSHYSLDATDVRGDIMPLMQF